MGAPLEDAVQDDRARRLAERGELAQLEYLLPRLRGWGESMSRQAGGQVGAGNGMGSRGPGETKIELDRRRIHSRMAKLRRQIAQMAPARETKRASRRRADVPSAAIVGYTNAGKSSLLNRLTGAGVLVENALFATLDATVRRSVTQDGREYTLVDTVGFVRNLPHQLVEAFRSTLEEAAGADVLVHVVDGSHPDPAGQIATVRSVLAETGVRGTELIAFNKADLMDDERRLELRARYRDAHFVSARTGEGVPGLIARIEELLPDRDVRVDVLLPYERGDLVAAIHAQGRVAEQTHEADGTRIRAAVPIALAAALQEFRAPATASS